MPGALVNFYQKLNPRRQPEESLPLRIGILASVIIAEVTILAMGYYSPLNLLTVPVLTAAGYVTSWKLRHRRNLALKLFLSLLVAVTAIIFLRELATNLYDTRLPLVKMLLWLQVLHSFDVPSRKDLKFSLASGAALVAAGAVLSTGMEYFLGLALFSMAAVVSLVYFYISEEAQRLDSRPQVKAGYVLRYAAITWLAGICLAIPVLFLIPQNLEARLYTLPFSNLQRLLGDFSGDVNNPYYPSGGDPFSREPRFNPDSYHGFNSYMDLRSRGYLSDDVVFKVKSAGYNFYRGVVFDRYNGKGWDISEERFDEMTADPPPFNFSLSNYLAPETRTRVETFYVQQDMPNVIFASWKPIQLYFPVDRIKTDQFQSIRSPYQLTAGTVYSVISDQPLYDPDFLRRFPLSRESDLKIDPQYTQLESMDRQGLERVEELAARVTAPYDTRYDKAAAIEDYLKENYPYKLDIPPQSKDMDATAYFLFEQKAGYCEHFASTMAVMARSAGIPARVVTGYTGGEYNPFTALWEIRQSDAHAWVEIYFGSAGWVPFDPTPGFDYPSGGAQNPWVMGKIFSYLGQLLGDTPAVGAIRAAVSFSLSLPFMPTLALLLGTALLALVIFRGSERLTRGRRRRRKLAMAMDRCYYSQPVLRDYLALTARLQELGLRRQPGETLRSFSHRVCRFLESDDFSRLSSMVECVRYGGLDPETHGAGAASLAGRIRERIRCRGTATGIA